MNQRAALIEGLVISEHAMRRYTDRVLPSSMGCKHIDTWVHRAMHRACLVRPTGIDAAMRAARYGRAEWYETQDGWRLIVCDGVLVTIEHVTSWRNRA